MKSMQKKIQKNDIQRLVMDVWNDDTEAFALLYQMTCDDVYNYCRQILGNDHKAMEAVKSTYSTAFRNILKLKYPYLFESWLRRIAFDVCYETAVADANSDYYSLLHPEVLESLSFSERQIFFMNDFVGMTESEISNALGISKRYVKKLMAAVREHMIQINNNNNQKQTEYGMY